MRSRLLAFANLLAAKVRMWHQGNELNEPVDRRLTGVKLTHPKRLQDLCS